MKIDWRKVAGAMLLICASVIFVTNTFCAFWLDCVCDTDGDELIRTVIHYDELSLFSLLFSFFIDLQFVIPSLGETLFISHIWILCVWSMSILRYLYHWNRHTSSLKRFYDDQKSKNNCYLFVRMYLPITVYLLVNKIETTDSDKPQFLLYSDGDSEASDAFVLAPGIDGNPEIISKANWPGISKKE